MIMVEEPLTMKKKKRKTISQSTTMATTTAKPVGSNVWTGAVKAQPSATVAAMTSATAATMAAANTTKTWPSSPVNLGDAIKKFLAAPVPPPPSYPLAMALKAKAVDTAAFDAFLSSSYHFTCQPAMHTFAAQQGTDFLLSELSITNNTTIWVVYYFDYNTRNVFFCD